MIKLIRENLKKIYDGCFVTDYVGDVRNLLINKPKPYRVVYDSKYDIYAIGDAEKYTHRELAENIVKSGYIYEITKNFDSDLEEMKDMFDRSGAFYDSEYGLYSECAFAIGQCLGFIFIPDSYNYFDYEDSGFYKAATKIETGVIFTKRKIYFSENGYFKQLYNALNRFGEIKSDRKSLEDIWKESSRYKNKQDQEYIFTSVAEENDYSYNEINSFLQKLPGNSLDDIYNYWLKRLGSDSASKAFFVAAKKYGYKKDELNDYLVNVVGVDPLEDSGVDLYYD